MSLQVIQKDGIGEKIGIASSKVQQYYGDP
jgi:hypothetical protein